MSRALPFARSDLQPSKNVVPLAELLMKMDDGVAAPTMDAKARLGGGMWASKQQVAQELKVLDKSHSSLSLRHHLTTIKRSLPAWLPPLIRVTCPPSLLQPLLVRTDHQKSTSDNAWVRSISFIVTYSSPFHLCKRFLCVTYEKI
jgi:hypothetical protein